MSVMLTQFNPLLALFLVLQLAACSAPKIAQVKYQPLFQFNDVKNYSFYQRNNAFSDWQALSDIKRNSIELAVEHALTEFGLQYTAPEQADIIFTYYWADNGGREFKNYNYGVAYCSYCLTHAQSGSKEDKLYIMPGSLILDAINPKSKRSVWRSSYPLNIKEKDNSQQVQDKMEQAAKIMLKDLLQPHIHHIKQS